MTLVYSCLWVIIKERREWANMHISPHTVQQWQVNALFSNPVDERVKIVLPLAVMWLSPWPCKSSPELPSPSTEPSRSGEVGVLGMARQRDRRTKSPGLSILKREKSGNGFQSEGVVSTSVLTSPHKGKHAKYFDWQNQRSRETNESHMARRHSRHTAQGDK